MWLVGQCAAPVVASSRGSSRWDASPWASNIHKSKRFPLAGLPALKMWLIYQQTVFEKMARWSAPGSSCFTGTNIGFSG
jgi:hypothetical protein